MIDHPFVLWLICGLVPWFFFSEALGSGTNALTEYSYLVKKVVFKIDILPIVKVISAVFVHLFFVVFIMVILMLMSVFCVRTTPVKAEETTNVYSVQEIVDNSVFVSFKKGDNTKKGKYMVACYFVPKEYYNPSYTYGVIIFPKKYGILHGLLGDYLKNSEEKGKPIINSKMLEYSSYIFMNNCLYSVVRFN
jgi:hypothetical protein